MLEIKMTFSTAIIFAISCTKIPMPDMSPYGRVNKISQQRRITGIILVSNSSDNRFYIYWDGFIDDMIDFNNLFVYSMVAFSAGMSNTCG